MQGTFFICMPNMRKEAELKKQSVATALFSSYFSLQQVRQRLLQPTPKWQLIHSLPTSRRSLDLWVVAWWLGAHGEVQPRLRARDTVVETELPGSNSRAYADLSNQHSIQQNSYGSVLTFGPDWSELHFSSYEEGHGTQLQTHTPLHCFSCWYFKYFIEFLCHSSGWKSSLNK